jgi:hypothetical protein
VESPLGYPAEGIVFRGHAWCKNLWPRIHANLHESEKYNKAAMLQPCWSKLICSFCCYLFRLFLVVLIILVVVLAGMASRGLRGGAGVGLGLGAA